MKIKTATIYKTKKIPIAGIQYSNKEASVSLTIEPENGEISEKDYKKIWEEIDREIDAQLFPEKEQLGFTREEAHDQLEIAKLKDGKE